MPNEQKRPQIESTRRISCFVKMKAGPIEIQYPFDAPAFPARTVVLYPIAEIHANPMTLSPKTQTKVDIGLALPIPSVESSNGAKSVQVNERAAGIGHFNIDDALPGRRCWITMQSLPPRENLVAGRENPR